MNKFIVVVFPEESAAYEATRALQSLHAEGSITLYGFAVVAKDGEGTFAIKEAADAGPLGTAVGALVGGLVGVIGGPIGMLAGAAGGTLFGGAIDLVNLGVNEDFVESVSQTMLEPGKTAVVAEIAETWTTPLDARMEALGGTVLRTWRADFEDEQLATEVAMQREELEQLQAEYAELSEEARATLQAKLDAAKAAYAKAERQLEEKIDSVEREAEAKIAALEQQADDADAEMEERVRRRLAALRSEYETRRTKLKQAWALTREAVAA